MLLCTWDHYVVVVVVVVVVVGGGGGNNMIVAAMRTISGTSIMPCVTKHDTLAVLCIVVTCIDVLLKTAPLTPIVNPDALVQFRDI